MNSEILNKMLSSINYIPNDELKAGELNSVFFDSDTKELFLTLTLPQVPSVENLVDFNNNVKKGLVDNCLATSVNIEYKYLNEYLNAEQVKLFYQFTVNALASKKLIYKSLESFETSFDNNAVSISVGVGNDVKFIRPMFEIVEKSFQHLGLNFIKFSLIVTPFILPTSQAIKISIEEDVNALERERFVSSTVKPKIDTTAPKNEKGYKPPKAANKINGKVSPISSIPLTESELIGYNQRIGNSEFVVEGVVSNMQINVTKNGYRIYSAILSDNDDSIIIKTFISENNGLSEEYYKSKATNGNKLRIYGYAEYDKYSKDITLRIKDIVSYGMADKVIHTDDALVKRVELHAHSKMTYIDSILAIDEYVDRAIDYGHRAIALTDKNSVHGLGELAHLLAEKDKEKKILPIYGMEGYMVDESAFKVAFTNESISLNDATFVVYDFETTGLSSINDAIIEIGACKVRHGEIIDVFSMFVNPKRQVSKKITELTSITNDNLRNAPYIEEVLPKFEQFYEGSIMVAHNAAFDNSFLLNNLQRLGLYKQELSTIDTMNLAMARYSKKIKRFGLDDVRKAFNVTLDQHHRACDDAKATAQIFIKMCNDLINDGITDYNQINSSYNTADNYKYLHPKHISILSLNRKGLVNMNRIVTDSNCYHFHRTPRITKTFLESHREGLLIGSGCFHGEIFELALRGDYQQMLNKASFYDYLEVQPIDAYKHLLETDKGDLTIESLQNAIKLIIKLGKETNKIVCATGDVHELDPEDKIYKKILYDKNLIGGGIHEFFKVENVPSEHYRNTQDMLDQFNFLDYDIAYEIVVINTNKIADMVKRYDLFPNKLFAPTDDFMAKFGVPSAKEAVKEITYQVAKEKYGETLPKIIEERIDKELNSIIGHGYATIYYIAYCLVKHSRDAGYVVGSRGSVGSSLVATFMRITEVNSLAPHYVCPKCKFSAFKYSKDEIKKYNPGKEEIELQEILANYNSGLDLPSKKCPICGEVMNSDGCNIPFETFLGFEGDKVPDIDLNFSGEYQAKAHAYCREIFGVENTFRGGTIGTIAERTAQNYVLDYYTKREINIRKCQIERLAPKIIGIKRQTGQHPGGIVVVPNGVDINEVTPVQYPADLIGSDWMTTHIDYHKFESNLLKLDILGHDDPTMIRYLMNFVDKNPSEFPFTCVEDIPIADKDVLKMFSGVDVLGVDSKIVRSEVASTGLPEFGTKLTKDMLVEIRPTSIADLIKISGLSHGKNVWNGNAQSYFLGTNPKYNKIPFEDLIGCRDDIMTHLIAKGVPAKNAFKIMESVRKGHGLKEDMEKLMKKNDVEGWFIDSCKIIKYLFPKAHATAYVIMALRIAWFKLNKPLYYYSGFFSKRTDAFDVVTMTGGYDEIAKKVDELSKNVREVTPSEEEEIQDNSNQGVKEKNDKVSSNVKMQKTLVGLKVALEMVARGYHFLGVHVNKSDALNFIIESNGLRIPFVAIDSFGENTANQIVANRGSIPFTSVKDASLRGHISATLIEKLMVLNAFEGLPKEDEIGLFRYLKDDNKDDN